MYIYAVTYTYIFSFWHQYLPLYPSTIDLDIEQMNFNLYKSEPFKIILKHNPLSYSMYTTKLLDM